jgi:curved DNA-binding protein CbpA
LGLEVGASSEAIANAYQKLAGRYNPRNSDTRDQPKFAAVTRAYEVLADPAARRAFDAALPKIANVEEAVSGFGGDKFFNGLAEEQLRRLTVLCILYDRRRQTPATPGLPLRILEQMVSFPGEALQFSLWYVKQRGLALADDQSCLQITADGIEYLERNPPEREKIYALLDPRARPGAAAQSK